MQVAKIVPNRKLPINDADLYPKISSIQCAGDRFVAIGMIEDRKILFIFELRQKYPSPLVIFLIGFVLENIITLLNFQLRVASWQVIEPSGENLYSFNGKDCFRVHGELLLQTGIKVRKKNPLFYKNFNVLTHIHIVIF